MEYELESLRNSCWKMQVKIYWSYYQISNYSLLLPTIKQPSVQRLNRKEWKGNETFENFQNRIEARFWHRSKRKTCFETKFSILRVEVGKIFIQLQFTVTGTLTDVLYEDTCVRKFIVCWLTFWCVVHTYLDSYVQVPKNFQSFFFINVFPISMLDLGLDKCIVPLQSFLLKQPPLSCFVVMNFFKLWSFKFKWIQLNWIESKVDFLFLTNNNQKTIE